jgi:hypothetical protein
LFTSEFTRHTVPDPAKRTTVHARSAPGGIPRGQRARVTGRLVARRPGTGWTLGAVNSILGNPRYTGRQGTGSGPTAGRADIAPGHRQVQRWNLPDGWVISARPARPELVSEADFIAAHAINAARGPIPASIPPRQPGRAVASWPGC